MRATRQLRAAVIASLLAVPASAAEDQAPPSPPFVSGTSFTAMPTSQARPKTAPMTEPASAGMTETGPREQPFFTTPPAAQPQPSHAAPRPAAAQLKPAQEPEVQTEAEAAAEPEASAEGDGQADDRYSPPAQKRRRIRRKPKLRKRPRTTSRARVGRMLVRGIRLMEDHQWSSAIVNFDKATRIDPSNANAFYHLGRGYYQRAFSRGSVERADKNDAQNAVDAFQTALSMDPRLASIKDPYLLYHGLAQCYESLGLYQRALKAIGKATSVSRRNPMPYLYAAKLRYKLRDFDRSSANLYYGVKRSRKINMYPALAKLIKQDPLFSPLMNVPQNKLILDSFDAVQNGILSVEEAKDRIREGPDSFRDALSPLPKGRRPGSLDVPTRDPGVLKYLERADRAFEHRHFRDAIEEYQGALRADEKKGTLDVVKVSMIYERIGSSYRSLGLTGEAVRVLKHAVAEMPENSAAHYQLALCYSTAGEFSNALASLNKALDNALTLSQLRETLLLARTDSELAPVRDLPRFQEIIRSHRSKLSARR